MDSTAVYSIKPLFFSPSTITLYVINILNKSKHLVVRRVQMALPWLVLMD